MLRRYWIKFEMPPAYSPLGLGCGVTAFDRDDALEQVRKHILGQESLTVATVTEDVDVRTLDPGHVGPNIGDVTRRGIWFPLGYERGT